MLMAQYRAEQEAYMAKFAATTLGDLLTVPARIGRAAREQQYASAKAPFVAVVHVEADDGSWCEMDAESYDHAIRLADNMVRLGARGASCRKLRKGLSGAVSLKAFYLKFAEYD